MAGKSKLILPFNAAKVKVAPPIDGKQTEYSIEGVRGLRLRVFPAQDGEPPTGVFTYRYAIGFGDRREQRRMRIGRRDAMTLHDARTRVEELRRDVEKGIDVARVAEARREAPTFRDLAEMCIHPDNPSLKDSTKASYRQIFLSEVYAVIGNKVAAEVTADDVVFITSRIAQRGSRIHADRVRTAIGSVYKFGRAERIVSNSPAVGLARHGTKIPRDRVLSDAEIATFWKGIHSPDAPASLPIRRIMMLALLTGQRRGEVAGARLQELDLDSADPTWTIPGDRNVRGKLVPGRIKSSRQQTVRLSRQAAVIFAQASSEPAVTDHVFPADDSKRTKGNKARAAHIHGESVSKAMRRARASKAMAADGAKVSMADITVHDLRRTMATFLGNRGAHPVVIEIILGHAGQGVTRKHYNHALMADQVREAMQTWADHIWKLTGQVETKPASEAAQPADAPS